MLDPTPTLVAPVVLALVTLVWLAAALSRGRFQAAPHLRSLWVFLLLLCIADWISFRLAIWLFAVFAFVALREYLSLVDIRLQDRWAILGAYLSIAFMTYFILIDWYGMFILSIPVYTFLVIPLLVAMGGGDPRGTVFSLGAIDLGLFLFVFCMGHIGYLTFFSVRMALLVILAVAYCDQIWSWLEARSLIAALAAATVGAVLLLVLAAPWAAIPEPHALILGFLIPLLVAFGSFTFHMIEEDLGVAPERLEPGRGLLMHSLKAYLFAAPVVFHYLRWFLHWGDL